jgi:hypothetical protein
MQNTKINTYRASKYRKFPDHKKFRLVSATKNALEWFPELEPLLDHFDTKKIRIGLENGIQYIITKNKNKEIDQNVRQDLA